MSMGGSEPGSAVSSRFGSKESPRGNSKGPPASLQASLGGGARGLPPVASSKNRKLMKASVASNDGDDDAMSIPSLGDLGSEAGSKMGGNHTQGYARASNASSNCDSDEGSMVKAGALAAGWTIRPPAGSGRQGSLPHAMENKHAMEFSSFAMGKLNHMYAYMEQAMAKERARHSSDVHLLMRKVDRDLKDTFKSVRDTFMGLTGQVQQLLREVEGGKKSICSIQDKFDAAKASAAIRAQYVEELEAVLDGQVPNISEAMRKLSEDLTVARANVEKVTKQAVEKEQAMNLERTKLQAEIRTLNERLNETEVSGFAGAAELPLLPEMSATWCRRASDSTSDGGMSGRPGSEGGMDAADTIMARSDATRGVSRRKVVRPLGSRPSTVPTGGIKTARSLTRLQQEQLTSQAKSLKERLDVADQRVAKQHQIFLDAAPSLQLLREIFSELRQNWRLKMPDEAGQWKDIDTLREELEQQKKAPAVLDKITHSFMEHFPQLGDFSTVLEACCEEAEKEAPQLMGVIDALEGERVDTMSSFPDDDGSLNPASPTPLRPASEDLCAVPETTWPSEGSDDGDRFGSDSFKPVSLQPIIPLRGSFGRSNSGSLGGPLAEGGERVSLSGGERRGVVAPIQGGVLQESMLSSSMLRGR